MVKLGGKGGQFMIVGGKQTAAFVDFMQVFNNRPSNGKPVKGCRATPDFIKNHQRPVGGLIKDRCGFNHFNHEGRSATGQIISRTHTRKQPVNHPDMGLGGRNKGTDLGQYRNQGILAQEGRFTGHVRTGNQPQALRIFKTAVIGNKRGIAIFAQGRFNHRMAAATDVKGKAVINGWADTALITGKFGKGG